MKLIKIQTVARAGNDTKRVYALDASGEVYFPRTKEMGETLAEGTYAATRQTEQTQTFDDQGELIPLAKPRIINQITSVFADKKDAIAAIAESRLLDAEVAATVRSEAKSLGLDEATVASLASSNW